MSICSIFFAVAAEVSSEAPGSIPVSISKEPSSITGMNSVPKNGNRARLAASSKELAARTVFLCAMLQASAGRYSRPAATSTGLVLSEAGSSAAAHSAGITVSDNSSEENKARITVSASGPNIFPSMPSSARIGIKVRAIISSPKILGFRTSIMASATDFSRLAASRLRLRWCRAFSTCIIVESIIMPMDMARPPNDMRLPVMPKYRMARKVSSEASGSAIMVTNEPLKLNRNR